MKSRILEEREERPMHSVPYVIRIGRKELLMIAAEQGIRIPAKSTVRFRVPTGGDYSGMDVELDDNEQVITISYERPICDEDSPRG